MQTQKLINDGNAAVDEKLEAVVMRALAKNADALSLTAEETKGQQVIRPMKNPVKPTGRAPSVISTSKPIEMADQKLLNSMAYDPQGRINSCRREMSSCNRLWR